MVLKGAVAEGTPPDRAAVIMGGSGEVLTFGELDSRSNQLAHHFRSMGLEHGAHVAILLENSPRMYEATWGGQRSGLYYTAISTRLTAPEVAYIVNDCGARMLITSQAMAEVVGRVLPECKGLESCLMVGDPSPGCESYEAALASQPTTPLEVELDGRSMLYSSGTTGKPKGIKRPLGREPFGTSNAVRPLVEGCLGFRAGNVYLSPAPLYHAAPLAWSKCAQSLGGTVVVMERFDAAATLELIERHRITHAQFVPTMFLRMLKLPEADRAAADASSLEGVVHAAAPCPVEVKQRMIEWWGPIIHEYYAGTEGNGITYLTSEEWLQHKGSVGRPLVGEVHIVNDQGEEISEGETGTVYFGGVGGFEYHNAPEKTAQSYLENGWSTLGDVGHLDADGFLYLTDRKAYMIVSGGVNIYPQETEDVLTLHPAVRDAAVFGVPHQDLGEEVKAVVQPADAANAGPRLEAELIAYCGERLASYKCPRSIDFEQDFPRADTGKLYKRLLRDRYWKDHKTRII